MKRLFRDMGISLLMGICFSAGILLVLLANEIYEERQFEEETWVDTPDGVFVASHQIKENTPRFTVVGEMRNDSSFDWKTIWVDVAVYAGDALVNTCDDSFRHFPANTNKTFEVQCFDVAGANLPDNIHYEVDVRAGRRVGKVN